MKKIKLLNILLTAVIFFNILSVTATAQPDDEFLDLYKAYFEDDNIIEVKPSSHTLIYSDHYNCYNVTKRLLDFCRIAIFTDTEIDMDLSELTDKMGYPPDMFSISYDFSKDLEEQFVKITFYTQEYDINSDIAKKLYDLLKAKYKIFYAYVYTYTEPVSETQAIVWDNFYLLDEFGYQVKTDEQLSKKQINRLRDEIIAGNFSDVADVDDDGKFIIYEQASEAEKLRFALWLREKYGYYARISYNIGAGMYILPSAETEVLHYTELPGDVNNNNYVNFMDAKALQEYLLSGSTDNISDDTIRYQCFNLKNADLTGDGVIDVFDLVLLRKIIIG